MPATIPVLWSDDISVDVLSPLAILRSQIEPLSRMTKGILEVGIETITSDSGKVQHQFDLVAPVLNGFRRRILLATHQADLVYPVVVEAECFVPGKFRGFAQASISRSIANVFVDDNPPSESERRASTDQEFIKLVGEVLRSPQIRSLIQSLIARSNDQNTKANSSMSENEDGPE